MKAKATREEQQSYLQMKIAEKDAREKRLLENKILIEIRTLKAMNAIYKLEQLTGIKIKLK